MWNLAKRAITKTIIVGDPARPAGTMEVQLIPGDTALRAYTAGMADGMLYLVDTQGGTAKAVFDFSTLADPATWPRCRTLLHPNRKGNRLFVSLNGAGKIAMFNIARPGQPQLMSVVDLGPDSGPHYLSLTRDEERLVVTDDSSFFLSRTWPPAAS